MITYQKRYQASAQLGGTVTVIAIPMEELANVGDHAAVRLNSSANSVTISSSVVTADTLTVTFSADPGEGLLSYTIIHPLS